MRHVNDVPDLLPHGRVLHSRHFQHIEERVGSYPLNGLDDGAVSTHRLRVHHEMHEADL